MWLRYIDDLFIIWWGTEEGAGRFIEKLKPTAITFCWQAPSIKPIEYLEVSLNIKEGAVCTTLFRKATAGNSVLHALSSHPEALKWSIPYGELLRPKRNCNNAESYEEECNIIMNRFSIRGYPQWVLKKAKKRADEVERKTTLIDKPTEPSGNETDSTRMIYIYI